MKQSKWFTAKELNCRCGCGFEPAASFVELLNQIREEYGQPIEVTSVARCNAYNRKIGGARFSQHKRGTAADLVRTPELLKFLLDNADRFNIWMEHPDYTPMHLHIDQKWRPTGRTFIP